MKKDLYKILGLAIFSIMLLTGCTLGSSKDKSDNNINIEHDEEIAVSSYVSSDNSQIILYVTNNFSYNIGALDIKAVYYDEKDQKITQTERMCVYLESGKECVTTLQLPQAEDDSYYISDKTDITITVDKEFQEGMESTQIYTDQIETKYSIREDEIQVTLNNRSDVRLDYVDYSIIYLKDDKPVYVDEIYGVTLLANQSVLDSSDLPSIEYDSVEIFVNSSVTEE